jgi:putative hemolysin
MDALWFEIFGVLLLILLAGFFSACEVAVLSTRKSRMQELADEGNRRASIILGFQTNPEQFLATIHVGIVFSLIFASGLGGLLAVDYLVPAFAGSAFLWVREARNGIALGCAALVIGFLVIVFGELVPKSLALRFAEPLSLTLAPALRLFTALFHYPGKFFTLTSNIVLLPFSDRTTFTESRISEEEFKLMLQEGTKTGVIDKTEQELIKSIFEFTDTTAKEVMIPRPDVVALNIDLRRESLLRVVLEEGYSRMPVYRETIDNILGVIYTKDLLGLLEHTNIIILQDIIRPAFFIPETKKISQLLRELQERKMHMAIVVDEFGGTEGIVTMEDVIEEIVGEIHDEYDEEIRDVEPRSDGSFHVNARMTIGDFNERFGSDVPEAPEYETISGFLHKRAGRIPDLNEEIRYNRLSFTIVKKSQRRIRVVRVKKLEPPPPTSDSPPGAADSAQSPGEG